jgi:VanZ family protein
MKRWAVLFGIFMVLVIVLADTRHLGFPDVVYYFPFGDKVGHFILYGILSLLVDLPVFEAHPVSGITRSAVVCSLILAIPIALEEFSQRWIHTRNFSLLDLAASCLGVAAFAWLAVEIQKRRSLQK